MVEHRTCDYTGEEIEPGTGIMYVQKDGSVLHFVDSKAEKNFKLGREPRDLEWTEDGRRGKGPVQEEVEAEEPEAEAEDEESQAEAEADADEDEADAEGEEAEADAEEEEADADEDDEE
ncbi:50S ribosomal protein L24e [Halobacteria archaeon AArc-curdl1]|uniref:Large ribosomal subunit protein eL24 n=1 Tax=Natronosalvus hydrolyticus TaxID=2979988 RepID=A0AAP2Z7H6_9EURY|nr:50S ribosomal protein L24e [Halobacteria archaeon AArc-curdl1]